MRGKVNSVSGDNIKFIEKEYDSATVYNEGDIALIRGVLYSCLVNNTTGTLNMDRWKRVYLSDLAEITSSEQALADMVDEVYDSSKVYNKDDTALYNEVLYICKNDGTTGKWNADLWEQTTLVSILNSNLGSVKIPHYQMYGDSVRGFSNLLLDVSKAKTFTIAEAIKTGNKDGTLRIYAGNTLVAEPSVANGYTQQCYYISDYTEKAMYDVDTTNISIDVSSYDYVEIMVITRDPANTSNAHCGWWLKNIECW